MAEADPFAKYATPDSAAGDDPFAKYAEPSAEPSPGIAADVGKSAAAAVTRVPLHPFGVIGDIRQAGEAVGRQLFGSAEYERRTRAYEADPRNGPGWLARLAALAPSTMDIGRAIQRRTGLPTGFVGETVPGRIAGGAVETALDPMSLALGPGGVLGRVGTGLAAGSAGAVGEEVAGPIGGLVGGGLGSLATASTIERSAARAAQQATRPTEANVRAAGGLGYDMARDLSEPLSTREVGDLGRDIRQNLTERYGHGPEVEPQTYRSIDRLIRQETARAPVRRRLIGADEPSTNTLLNTRQRLTTIARNNPAHSESTAARRAVDQIDNYLEQFPGLNPVLTQARADWRAASLSRELNESVAHAMRLPGNTADNLRAGVRRILENRKIPKTPEQAAAMERIIRNGRLWQTMSRHWYHGHSPLVLLSLLTGHPAAAVAFVGSGLARTIPRRLDVRGRLRDIEMLRENILRNAPSGGGPVPPLPSRIDPQQIPGAFIRSIVNPSLSDLAEGQDAR